MIIDDVHKFIFVHIPKTAGTSVRSILSRYDTQDGKFSSGVQEHEVLGKVDLPHLPLTIVDEYFPSQFRKFDSYLSFALVRNPKRRFSSSLYQRLKMYGKYPVKALSKGDIKVAVNETIDFLDNARNRNFLPYEYIHFQKQNSYIYNGDRKIVTQVYLVQHLDQLLSDLEKILGESLIRSPSDVPHKGKSEFYRAGWIRMLSRDPTRMMDGFAKLVLKTPLKHQAQQFIYAPIDTKGREILDSAYVNEFIEDYYAEDLELYKTIANEKRKDR